MPTKSVPTVMSLDDGIGTPEVDNMIVGMRFDFAGTVPPPKALACDGSAVSRTTYAALFAAIGTAWGAGDGVATFNLPDDQDRHARGKGAGTAVGQAVGSDTHTISVAELPAHQHGGGSLVPRLGLPIVQSAISATAGNASVQGLADGAEVALTVAGDISAGTTDNTGGGGSIPTVPHSNIYLPCIYAGV